MWWFRLGGVVLLQALAVVSWGGEASESPGGEKIFIDEQGLDSLARQAERTGWRVEKEKDGSLLLFPPGGRGRSPEKQAGDVVAPVGDMSGLEKALRARGWKTTRGKDGALLLFLPEPDKGAEVSGAPEPARSEAPSSQSADQAGAVPVAKAEQGERADSLEELKKLASQRGWRTQWDEEGNLLLFPAGSGQEQSESAPRKASVLPLYVAATSDCQFDRIPVSLSEGLNLPIDRWGEARKIATLWLRLKGDEGESVGRIREVNNLYIVSIVLSTAPHKLRKQLVIYKPDGRVMAFP